MTDHVFWPFFCDNIHLHLFLFVSFSNLKVNHSSKNRLFHNHYLFLQDSFHLLNWIQYSSHTTFLTALSVEINSSYQHHCHRASLVAQWLRIHLPMQETQVRSLAREDPTCRGATKPVCHNYWACALQPMNHNYWARVLQLLKPAFLEPVLRNEKPPQWVARALQRRVAPARRN